MSFKFGYLGGKVEESYNRFLTLSDLKDLDKDRQYLVLAAQSSSSQGELCYLNHESDFELYNDEENYYCEVPMWCFNPVDGRSEDFDEELLKEEKNYQFLLLDKDLWGY